MKIRLLQQVGQNFEAVADDFFSDIAELIENGFDDCQFSGIDDKGDYVKIDVENGVFVSSVCDKETAERLALI